MKKVLIFTLLLSLIFGGSIVIESTMIKADMIDEISSVKVDSINEANLTYVESYDESSSYYGVYQNWMSIDGETPLDTYSIDYNNITGGTLTVRSESYDYDKNTIKVEPGEEITFSVDVNEEGLYELYLEYYLLPETRLRPAVSFEINHETQYNEMANIEVPTKWYVEEEPVLDRFDDELTPNSFLRSEWSTFTLEDPNFFFIEPMKVYLKEGVNEINMKSVEGYFLIGEILVGNMYQEPSTYSEYLNEYGEDNTSVTELVIEAERYLYENRQNIRAKFVRNPSLTPYSYKNRVLNVLDQASFRKSGDSVTYQINVEETGYYTLSFKYLQNANDELDSHVAIYIDGTIPFKELESVNLPYSRNWDNITVSDESNNPYQVYLEEGSHQITLQVNNKELRDLYHDLLAVLDELDELAREVNKITGGLNDRYRDYKLDVYIPTIKDDLTRLKEEVIKAQSEIIRLYGTDDLSILSELDLCIKYFDQFIENPDEIPAFQYRFNEGDTSIYGKINTILPKFLDNPVQLDKIYLSDETFELPKANVNFFVRTYEGIKSFVYSFFDPKYNETTEVDDQTIEIWVRQSRLYIQVMQRMADEFTAETGIKVDLSVMPDENKIVLANAANNTPDAAMGLSVTRPFEFAIRDMVVDLSEKDGFYDLTSEFNPNSFIPFIYEDGVYSIPETMDVKLLFYRTDIFEFLGVEPPQTWEEVISLIPVMQRYNYQFYTPLGGDNAFKTYGETTPFIYQFHGDIYNETGDKVIYNDNGSYEAFEFMTDLFSVYNVPITTSNFFQWFRDGLVPIGIGDGNMYIQLKYAAPELAGQWAVMPIPGIEYEYEDGTCPGPLTDGRCIERWDPTYGTSSVIFKDSDKSDMVWEYYKWWFSSDVQSDFTYQLQSILGDEFLYMTANVEAFKTSAWPSDSKYQVLEQWEWIRTVGKVPGDYLAERELSNAWNTVVNDGTNARVAIDDAVAIVNRELRRKLTEFGYYEDGEMIKPYIIPTYKNIHLWMTEGGGNDE